MRIRRTDSDTAALASGFSSRRACSRSSDEIVCRLFFTRWWISRIVASLLISSRSRLRRSVTSRTSSTPPAISPPARIGRQRHSRATSDAGSNSSTIGMRCSYALRTMSSWKPSSASVMPTALAWMPTRCSAELAFGDRYVTRPAASRLITPSPTRGAAVESAPRAGYGNEPSAIIPAKRSKIVTYVRSSSPGGRPARCTHSRVSTAIGRAVAAHRARRACGPSPAGPRPRRRPR